MTAPSKPPDAPPSELVQADREARAIDRRDEPPVVARLVIEIRSDGTRTIARGAAEDVLLGEKVAIEAEGTTPLALAASLARSLFSLPALARTAARALLGAKKKSSDTE